MDIAERFSVESALAVVFAGDIVSILESLFCCDEEFELPNAEGENSLGVRALLSV